MSKPNLNLGCGYDMRGEIRIDVLPSKAEGLNLYADAHYLPLRDKIVGITLCKSVLEHVVSPYNVLIEMKRVTANKIIISVPNTMNLRRIWRTLRNPLHEVNPATKHFQSWDAKAIKHLACLTNLIIKSITWMHESQRWKRICRLTPFLCSHMVVILVDSDVITN